MSHTLPKLLTAEEAEYVERWRREGILCEAPAGMNDDWYWLHAALASGAQCRVISNDEMRDHHFGMMNSSTFLRWKERHIVHFNLPYVEPPARPTPTLTPPRPYSSVMQEHPDGLWHLPCADKIDTWLCLEPPRLEPHSQ